MNILTEVITAINNAQNVIISGHMMPDGDSIGSTLALGLALQKMGKKVTMTSPDAVPEMYLFLPGANKIHQGLPAGDIQYDTFFMLDCSVPDRLGDKLRLLLNQNIKVVNIDHHANVTPFADVSYIDSQAAATGEIIYDLLLATGVDLDLDMAVNLYTAIVTDTGSFRYEATTPGTHRRIAALLECGVVVSDISRRLFEEKPLEVFKVLQKALPTLERSTCGKVAWISLDWQSRQVAGAKEEHAEELVNYPRSIKGVEVALMFRESSPGVVKVSIRSNRSIDVSKIAAEFGGGGHKRASGCLIKGKLDEVKEQLLKAVIKVVSN